MQRRIYIKILTTEPFSKSYIFQIFSFCTFRITIYLMQDLLDSLGPGDFFIDGRITDRHSVHFDNVSVDTSCKCNLN